MTVAVTAASGRIAPDVLVFPVAGKPFVIRVTRFNGSKLYVNAEMISFVEGTPDTVISLTDGTKIVVSEAAEKVVADIIAYRQQVNHPPALQAKEA